MHPSAHFPPRRPRWGLQLATDASAARTERRWRTPVLLALLLTVPAFYAELLSETAPLIARAAYALAAATVAAALALTARQCARPARHLRHNPVDIVLACGLLVAAALPASQASPLALGWRLVVSAMVLMRMVWALQGILTRGGLAYLMLLAMAMLGVCGVGFWWLEPSVHTLHDGLWLAFTTAATVGYGDIVPTTPASRIFAVFVVLLGFGVLSTVTAAIAAMWIETEERRIEREILGDLRRQIDRLHEELAALRRDAQAAATARADATGSPAGRRRSASRRSRS